LLSYPETDLSLWRLVFYFQLYGVLFRKKITSYVLKHQYSFQNSFKKDCSLQQVHRVSNAIPAFLFENHPLAGCK